MPRHTARPALTLLTALALGAAAMSAPAQSPPQAMAPVASNATLLSVSVEADARRVPDIATLSAGVVTQGADANAALRANAEQMSTVVKAIRAAGIAERDVQTSHVSLNPQYRYAENEPPTITGYQASNTVNIVVRDIGRLGRILDALVATGANQVNGPSFEIDDKDAAFDEARRAAIEKARARARLYAETLGMKVRRIVSVSEASGQGPIRPVAFQAMARSEKAMADTPIAPGETTLTAHLDVVFELSP